MIEAFYDEAFSLVCENDSVAFDLDIGAGDKSPTNGADGLVDFIFDEDLAVLGTEAGVSDDAFGLSGVG